MNSSVQANEQFKFTYSTSPVLDNSDYLLQLVEEYHIANPVQSELPAQGLDLVFEINSDDYFTLSDISDKLSDSVLLEYVAPILIEAKAEGITSLLHFRMWIQGKHPRLKYPNSQLDGHTHLDGRLDDNAIINTHTVIFPVLIKEPITEKFWAHWIDNVEKTLTPKLKIISSIDISAVPEDIKIPAYYEWWQKLEETTSSTSDIKFPDYGEKLTLDFNSRSNLHGIKNIGNNLYLVILFDRCKK